MDCVFKKNWMKLRRKYISTGLIYCNKRSVYKKGWLVCLPLIFHGSQLIILFLWKICISSFLRIFRKIDSFRMDYLQLENESMFSIFLFQVLSHGIVILWYILSLFISKWKYFHYWVHSDFVCLFRFSICLLVLFALIRYLFI